MAGLPNNEAAALLNGIDRIPELSGLGVVFIGRGMCQVLRESSLPEGLGTFVVLKEEETSSSPASMTSAPPPSPATGSSSNVWGELLDAGINCTGAALAGVTAVGSATAAPITAGTSLVVTSLATTAAVAGALQCGYSTGRLINSIFWPENNAVLDDTAWITTASQVLDGIALVGGLAGLGQTAKGIINLSRSTGRPLKDLIKNLSRAERKRLAQDLARYAGDAQTRRQFIRLARAGKIPKIFRQKEISKALLNMLLDNIATALAYTGSAKSGLIHVYFIED